LKRKRQGRTGREIAALITHMWEVQEKNGFRTKRLKERKGKGRRLPEIEKKPSTQRMKKREKKGKPAVPGERREREHNNGG